MKPVEAIAARRPRITVLPEFGSNVLLRQKASTNFRGRYVLGANSPGIERVPSKYEKWAAWQRPGEAPKLWVGCPYNRLPANWGNGWMAALSGPTRAGVDAAYAAAMASGGYDEGHVRQQPRAT